MTAHVGTKPNSPRAGTSPEIPSFDGNPFASKPVNETKKAPEADRIDTAAFQGQPQAVSENPKRSLLVRGLKGAWAGIQKPIFSYPKGQTEFAKDDFFATPKSIINKIWQYKPALLAGGAIGGGIAVGVIFTLAYKAAIIGALGAFFSSHVGWGVAAGIGAVGLIVAAVYLSNYLNHRDHQKQVKAHNAFNAKLTQKHEEHKAEVSGLHAQIGDLAKQLQDLQDNQSKEGIFKRGVRKGRNEGFEAGREAGREAAYKEAESHYQQHEFPRAEAAGYQAAEDAGHEAEAAPAPESAHGDSPKSESSGFTGMWHNLWRAKPPAVAPESRDNK